MHFILLHPVQTLNSIASASLELWCGFLKAQVCSLTATSESLHMLAITMLVVDQDC